MSEFSYGVPMMDKKKIGDAMKAAAYQHIAVSKLASSQIDIAIATISSLAAINPHPKVAISHSGNLEDPDHFVLNICFGD